MPIAIPFCPRRLILFVTLLTIAFSVSAQNKIYLENQNAGNPESEWLVPFFRDTRINGFATKMSLTPGQTVHFKIYSQGNAPFTLKIYRLGYYQANGARLMDDLGTLPGVQQPEGISDPVSGLYDCNNWSESAQWNIPANAVSGLYVAKIVRNGVMADGSNHIVFVVRDDAGNSDMLLQFPDATWQAYNGYGGNSLYDGTTNYPNGHATKVSYNRPFFVYNSLFDTNERGANWYMNNEYAMIRWVERNGYDVSYTTNEDLSQNPNHLTGHRAYVTIGHDEYWSKEQRQAVETARGNGLNMAFFTGNDVYWKTRWEPDGDGVNYRTLVCFKEGTMGDGSINERACAYKCDVSTNEWTGLWRKGADYDAGLPENALTGQIGWLEFPADITVPAAYKKIRLWRNTAVTGLGAGQQLVLAPNTLGYEWDYEQYPATNPPGRFTVSKTEAADQVHKLSFYRHASGALIFGAGTIQWSWGLDSAHWDGGQTISRDMQQATVNLFADMNVQPFSRQTDLTAATISTDFVKPASVITTPPAGASFVAQTNVTIAGTATDAGGGVVAGVEVSTDGGLTWRAAEMSAADGSVTWSYSWVPTAQGNVVIKTRAVDDSGNLEVPGTGTTVTVTPPVCPCTIFRPTLFPDNVNANSDDPGRELGVRFRTNTAGVITAIRFYKANQNTGTHTGSLWSTTGTLLGRVVFTNESGTGWQEATFATPIAVTAGTTYVASYTSTGGYFSSTDNFFTSDYPAGPAVNWPIQALQNIAPTQLNGVYVATTTPAFPTESGAGTNYLVDVVFNNVAAPTATLNGTVALQGRGAAPSPLWTVPVTLDFYSGGNTTTPAFSKTVTPDQNGTFSITSLPLANYSITARTAFSLKRVKLNQNLVAGANAIDFGTLLSGDLNNDNVVDFIDIVILLSSYNKATGDPAYVATSDLNSDGIVNFPDVTIMMTNYNQAGEHP